VRAKVWLSEAAAVDIVEQADWYQHRSGEELAIRWESEVVSALIRIEKNPRSGAKGSFRTEELHEVRRMPIEGFPKHLILYREQDTEIIILRVVHGARDLENLF
jgi:toxin ParE1/3/4